MTDFQLGFNFDDFYLDIYTFGQLDILGNPLCGGLVDLRWHCGVCGIAMPCFAMVLLESIAHVRGVFATVESLCDVLTNVTFGMFQGYFEDVLKMI